MTASLTENSFPSTRCRYELNVSSTWWMDLSAKIYFDQVSAPFCLTPWLSLFSPLSSLLLPIYCFSSFFVKQLHSIAFLFFLSYSRQAWCLAVICEPEPWAMCFRVSEWAWVCVRARHWSRLQSVRRPSRVIDWSSAEWPETRGTYAELF